jgi:hypothetical protein
VAQRARSFRSDLPAQWHLSTLLALIHAASGELQAKRLRAAEIESALVATVLGALGATPPTEAKNDEPAKLAPDGPGTDQVASRGE